MVPPAWVEEPARALAASLEARDLPRAIRPAARRALASAFDALEAGTPDADLVRTLEGLLPRPLHPPPPSPDPRLIRPPLPRQRRVGLVFLRGSVDATLVERCVDRWLVHERITARLQRVIDTFRTPIEPLHQTETRPSKLAAQAPPFALTEG